MVSVNINGKWGYKDKNDSLVIAPQYDYAQLFENGIAKVLLDKKWGYIDTLNQIVIPISYDVILPTEDSTLRVCKDLKWELIDLRNNIISPIKYNQIGKFGGEMYNDSLFQNLAKVYKNNKTGFINTKGQEIIPAIYDEIESGYHNQHYYWTRLGDKYGYVTADGVFCEPVFDKVGSFHSDDYYRVDDNKIVEKIGKYAKVIYQGKTYFLGENGIIYPYKETQPSFFSLFKNPSIIIDFDNGIKVSKK